MRLSKDRSDSVAQSKISDLLTRATRSTLIPPNFEYVEHLVVIPPDGGWGWLIVVMAFICYFLIDGVMYTFGLFLDEISQSFKVHPTQIAITVSLMSGFYFVVGPFTCAVTNRYGFRLVGVLGGIISCLAFFFSTIFTNFNAFLILMGVICGIGFNMIYIPCLLIVGFYFEKWRALATAISLCGSSIGVIAFPPIVTSLMRDIHWTWKFRILSGLTLLTSVCAFTFRPIQPVSVFEEGKKNTLDTTVDESVYSLNIERESKQYGGKSIFKTYHNTMFPTALEYHDASSAYSMSRRIAVDDSDPSIARSTFIYKTDNQSLSLSTVYELENENRNIVEHDNLCKKWCRCCRKNALKRNLTSAFTENINRPLYRDDIFYTGSLALLPEYSKATVAAGTSSKKSSLSYHLSVTRLPTQRDIEQTGQCVCCPEAVMRTIATMLHLKLLKSPTFVLLTISGFFSMTALYCPFIFLVQRAADMGISADWTNLLLTVIGIANTLGRISCGVISWFPKISLLAVNYVTLIIAGGIIIVSNYLTNLEGQIAFAAIFGFTIASLMVLRSVVVVELLGLENLTNAFGITSMFFGVGSFIGIPVAIALYEYTGRYDASYIFSGCSMLLSGFLIIPLRWISKWENEKLRRVSFKA